MILNKPYSLLECHALLQSQRVRFGNDWDHIDDVGELLQDDNVNWLESMIDQHCNLNHAKADGNSYA